MSYVFLPNTWLIHSFLCLHCPIFLARYYHYSHLRSAGLPHPSLFLRYILHTIVRVIFLIHKYDYITCLFPFECVPKIGSKSLSTVKRLCKTWVPTYLKGGSPPRCLPCTSIYLRAFTHALSSIKYSLLCTSLLHQIPLGFPSNSPFLRKPSLAPNLDQIASIFYIPTTLCVPPYIHHNYN